MAGGGDTAPKSLSGAARGLRIAHLFVAWLFVVTILVQVFFAGLMIFTSSTYVALHRDFGYSLLFLPLAMLILAPLGRLPRRAIILDGVLVLLYFVQTTLPIIRDPSVVAALHPVVALLLFGLASMVAVRARALVPRPLGTAPVETTTPP